MSKPPRLTNRSLRTSSATWLKRQLADPYVARAQREGWRSRAVFKLQEMDTRLGWLRPGQRVLDLGAAPGGWSQHAAQAGCRVVAVDLLPIIPIPGVTIIEGDATDPVIQEQLRAALGGPADLILSDMAPNTTGHPATDHLRSLALVEMAIDLASSLLRPGGNFLTKLFQGGSETALATQLRQHFTKVQILKPKASRAESREVFLAAAGYHSRHRQR